MSASINPAQMPFSSLIQKVGENSPDIPILNLSDHHFQPGELEQLTLSLSTNSIVTHLALNGCSLQDDAALAIATLIKKNT